MIAQPFLIIANWKANKTILETIDWVKKFERIDGAWTSEYFNSHENIQVVIAAPYMVLDTLDTHLASAGLQEVSGCTNEVGISSQDISIFPAGAYTGEMPGEILENLVTHCLIGHSERRKYMGEKTEMIDKKLERAVRNQIIPIICAQNIEEIPTNIRNYNPEQYMIMYEPSEAISTEGKYHPESPDKINSVLLDWQQKLHLKCRLLYGGSVNPENCQSIIENCKLLSGFVIGHASLDPTEFFRIITTVSNILPS